jgi:hypothetical protein
MCAGGTTLYFLLYALTETLAQELGLQHGTEEITRQLNRVFGVQMHITMADRGGSEADLHFARLRWIDLDLFDGQRLTKCIADRSFHHSLLAAKLLATLEKSAWSPQMTMSAHHPYCPM